MSEASDVISEASDLMSEACDAASAATDRAFDATGPRSAATPRTARRGWAGGRGAQVLPAPGPAVRHARGLPGDFGAGTADRAAPTKFFLQLIPNLFMFGAAKPKHLRTRPVAVADHASKGGRSSPGVTGMSASIVPESRAEAIAFLQARIAAWTANAAEIGISVEQATSLSGLILAAADAQTTQIDLTNQKEAATTAFHASADAMRDAAVALVGTIKSYAKYTNDPSVYALAQLPPPADREPTPAPGVPFEPTIRLLGGGGVEIGFKSVNPGNVFGVTYEVYRQLDGQGEFTYVLTSGERKFVDQGLPPGTSVANYLVRGRRTTTIGEFAEFIVRLAGGNQASVSVKKPEKEAS